MEKNYYDILEINKNASPEIVKKAYTTLAKKYHPDLQENELKKDSEEKLKLINEAYEVLSDEEKRKEYDAKLFEATLENEKIADELLNENINLKNELNRIKNQNTTAPTSPNFNQPANYSSQNQSANMEYQNQIRYNQELQAAREKAYHDAYIQDLKNRGYKIKYKKTAKEYFENFVALLITAFILFLLWQIPFVKIFFVSIYEDNPIIHTLLSPFINLFNQ